MTQYLEKDKNQQIILAIRELFFLKVVIILFFTGLILLAERNHLIKNT